MTVMTNNPDQLRDVRGKFATQIHSKPETSIGDLEQNADGHYGWETPLFDLDPADAGELQRWTDETADEYFAGPEPDMTEGPVNIHDRTTWGDAPF